MDPRHALALLLIAWGAFCLLVGAITACIGIVGWVGAADPIAVSVSLGFLLYAGMPLLLVGALSVWFAVRLYRRSDHALAEVRDRRGNVINHFPVLSPIVVIVFLLITALGAVSVLSYGIDWHDPESCEAVVSYAVLATLLLGATAAWLQRRLGWPPRQKPPAGGAPPAEGPGENAVSSPGSPQAP
jgi:hypothetical protein